uniref:Uncharacterized protein n=1 Tax=Haptolina brevifila TaxID=156173 RepID=A0A7S2MMD7_9EUKA
MSTSGGTGTSGGIVPSWASRANERLMPSFDLPAIKKHVHADVKELRKAADLLAALGAGAKKRPESAQTVGAQLLSISAAARERARATSRTLREALGIAEEGSAAHRTLSTLSEEFKQALLKFQQQVEATTHLVPPAVPSVAAHADIETGGGWDGCGMSAGGHTSEDSIGVGGSSSEAQQQAMEQEEQQRVHVS